MIKHVVILVVTIAYILEGFCIIFLSNIPTKTDVETEKNILSFPWGSSQLLRMVLQHKYTNAILCWTNIFLRNDFCFRKFLETKELFFATQRCAKSCGRFFVLFLFPNSDPNRRCEKMFRQRIGAQWFFFFFWSCCFVCFLWGLKSFSEKCLPRKSCSKSESFQVAMVMVFISFGRNQAPLGGRECKEKQRQVIAKTSRREQLLWVDLVGFYIHITLTKSLTFSPGFP